jgi:hypothetical protein
MPALRPKLPAGDQQHRRLIEQQSSLFVSEPDSAIYV